MAACDAATTRPAPIAAPSSRTKTSSVLLVSPDTSIDAWLANATYRPPELTTGDALV